LLNTPFREDHAVRRFLKFLHTLGAAGLTGAIAALAVVLILAPASTNTAGAASIMVAMAKTAQWIVGPSMIATVVTGLLAMLATPAFYNAGWVWLKAATGLLILEGGLHVLGPLQEEAQRGASALAGGSDPASVAHLFSAESNTLWVLLAVSVANIALGVWRPRMPKLPV
jgi:uncharacterized membrane protein